MTKKEFIHLFDEYPDDIQVRLLVDRENVVTFAEDNFILTSDTAYINPNAPVEEWDCEDGKIELGDGEPYILLNPVII